MRGESGRVGDLTSSTRRRDGREYPSLSSPDDFVLYTPFTPQPPWTPSAPLVQRHDDPAPPYEPYETPQFQAHVPLEMLPEPVDTPGPPNTRLSSEDITPPRANSDEAIAWRPTLSRSAPSRWSGTDNAPIQHSMQASRAKSEPGWFGGVRGMHEDSRAERDEDMHIRGDDYVSPSARPGMLTRIREALASGPTDEIIDAFGGMQDPADRHSDHRLSGSQRSNSQHDGSQPSQPSTTNTSNLVEWAFEPLRQVVAPLRHVGERVLKRRGRIEEATRLLEDLEYEERLTRAALPTPPSTSEPRDASAAHGSTFATAQVPGQHPTGPSTTFSPIAATIGSAQSHMSFVVPPSAAGSNPPSRATQQPTLLSQHPNSAVMHVPGAVLLPGDVPLDRPALAGSNRIEVPDSSSFRQGRRLVINPGGPNEETHYVVAFGSIIIGSPLTFDHRAGEIVRPVNDEPPAGLPLGGTPLGLTTNEALRQNLGLAPPVHFPATANPALPVFANAMPQAAGHIAPFYSGAGAYAPVLDPVMSVYGHTFGQAVQPAGAGRYVNLGPTAAVGPPVVTPNVTSRADDILRQYNITSPETAGAIELALRLGSEFSHMFKETETQSNVPTADLARLFTNPVDKAIRPYDRVRQHYDWYERLFRFSRSSFPRWGPWVVEKMRTFSASFGPLWVRMTGQQRHAIDLARVFPPLRVVLENDPSVQQAPTESEWKSVESWCRKICTARYTHGNAAGADYTDLNTDGETKKILGLLPFRRFMLESESFQTLAVLMSVERMHRDVITADAVRDARSDLRVRLKGGIQEFQQWYRFVVFLATYDYVPSRDVWSSLLQSIPKLWKLGIIHEWLHAEMKQALTALQITQFDGAWPRVEQLYTLIHTFWQRSEELSMQPDVLAINTQAHFSAVAPSGSLLEDEYGWDAFDYAEDAAERFAGPEFSAAAAIANKSPTKGTGAWRTALNKGHGKGRPIEPRIERRPGDWDCPDCGTMNFAFRKTCFKQSCPSNGGPPNGGRPPPGTGPPAKGDGKGKGKTAQTRDAFSPHGPGKGVSASANVAAGSNELEQPLDTWDRVAAEIFDHWAGPSGTTDYSATASAESNSGAHAASLPSSGSSQETAGHPVIESVPAPTPPTSSNAAKANAAQLPPELAELSPEELALAARALQRDKERRVKATERKRANVAATRDRIDNIEKALGVLAEAKKDQTPTEEEP